MTTLAHLAALLPLLLRRACVGQPHLSICELAAVRREYEDSSISARRSGRLVYEGQLTAFETRLQQGTADLEDALLSLRGLASSFRCSH